MIKKIVFDLDGTLWQTTNSYVYAYHKLCDFYGVKDKVSDEKVTEYLGVRLNVLLSELFPTVDNKKELALQALNFSVEYLINHQNDCCYDGVYDLLKKLSEKHELYIVSNCLKGYVETFLQISKTKTFIKDFYTIEQGEKSEHLNYISQNGIDKTLYIGDSDDDYLAIENHYRIIFCYAKYGYKNCLNYDYKIEKPTELLDLIAKIEIKERKLAGKEHVVISYKDNNLTYIKNSDGSNYFGFVNYVDESFVEVIKELKRESKGSILGPIDGNTFYSYRFAIDNFDTIFYPDCNNGPKVVQLFLDQGFTFKQYYVSTIATVNKKIWDLSKLVKLPIGYSVKVVSGKDAYNYLDSIYEVTVDAFSDADYYEEISKEDFIDIYLSNINEISPDIVLIFCGDELVGYNFCYEDPLKRYYVCKTTAIKKCARNRKLIMIMVDYSYSLLVNKGYKYALHHFQNERTKTLHAIFKGHEVLQKHYALLELRSDNE